MKDRGMIKWQPFDSVTSSKQMVQSILKEKSKVPKPNMSEEQMQEIEEKITEGFHTQSPLRIVYFWHGRYQVKQNLMILEIIPNQKKIIFEDHSFLYFEQILTVSLI